MAAVLLAGRPICRHFNLPHPSVEQLLAATSASRTHAYSLSAALVALLPTLVRPVGRPAGHRSPQPDPEGQPATDTQKLSCEVLRFVYEHPGCVSSVGTRKVYSDELRSFILDKQSEHAAIPLEVFSALVEIPLGTLKAWLAYTAIPRLGPSTGQPKEDSTVDASQQPLMGGATSAEVQTLLLAWKGWNGSFLDFVRHAREQLHIPYGRALISHILEVHRDRIPRRRQGRSPDELALRNAFQTFFPGAQWVIDGKTVRVVVGEQSFTFNLELNVDTHTGALVGLNISDSEDSEAVIDAFNDSVATTGAPPLAQLLDNKPSNHAPEVDATLTDTGTIRLRSTLGRPQNKAHVEGAFGLFSQMIPTLQFDLSQAPREIARRLLFLITLTWARTLNHRPRADRDGRSRVELYFADAPTDEQIEQARQALNERCRRQEQARATMEARQNPVVRQLLDLHFDRLGLADPERHSRLAIARYPLDAIVDGIAIFEGKRNAGTLPADADARYLLGIVRNVSAQNEGAHLTEVLFDLRTQARDLIFASLQSERDAVCHPSRAFDDIIKDCVRCALETPQRLHRHFWLQALAEVLAAAEHPAELRRTTFQAASRQIYATFSVPPRERQEAVCFLADRVVGLN